MLVEAKGSPTIHWGTGKMGERKLNEGRGNLPDRLKYDRELGG